MSITLPITVPARVTLRGAFVAAIAVLILLLLAIIGYQRAETHGMKFLCVSPFGKERCLVNVEGWKPRALAAEEARDTLADDVEHWSEIARNAAKAHRQQMELVYSRIATEADTNEREATNQAIAAVDRYAADNQCPAAPAAPVASVRGDGPPDRSARSGAGPSAADNAAELPPPVPTDPFVSVRQSDLRACAQWVSYGIAARGWGLKVEAASAAQQEPAED